MMGSCDAQVATSVHTLAPLGVQLVAAALLRTLTLAPMLTLVPRGSQGIGHIGVTIELLLRATGVLICGDWVRNLPPCGCSPTDFRVLRL